MKFQAIISKCEWCQADYVKGKQSAKYCSLKCAQSFSNEKKRLDSQVEFLKDHGEDPNMPTCKECGWKAFDLTTHITKFHKIPMKDYYVKHKCTTLDVLHEDRRKERSDRKAGDKNPFYQHDGKFSHVSKNCVTYVGLSDEEKEKQIKEVQLKQAEGRENGEGYTTRLDYWINKGFTESEARVQLRNRQRTFSLDICVMKYGQEEGNKKWLSRQQIWLESYYDKSEEELQDIFRRKNLITNNTSKPALKLFETLNHPTAQYEDGFDNREGIISTLSGTKYSVDYCIPEDNLIIEFYGDLWHANPLLYEPEEHPIYWSTTSKSAEEIWENDLKKVNRLINSGYRVLVVWEHDWKTKPEETIKRCKDFLGLV